MDTIDTFRDTVLKTCHGEVTRSLAEPHKRTTVLAEIALQSDMNTDAAIALLEDAFSGIDFGMALLDENMNFVLFNETFVAYAFLGMKPPEIGDNAGVVSIQQFTTGYYKMPAGMDPAQLSAAFQEAIVSGAQAITLTRADGRHFEVSSKRTQLGGYLVSVADVTDCVNTQSSEQARWEGISEFVNSLEEGVSVWDADMRFLMCNHQYMRDMASHRSEPFPVGMRGEDVIAETYHSGILTILPEGSTEEQIVDYYMNWARECAGTEDIYLADGRFITANAKKTDLGGVLITTRDVTEERNSEAKARDMLFDAIESLEEGFALYDEDLRFVTCNQNYVDMALFYRDSPYDVGTTLEEGARESFRAGVVDLPDGLSEDRMAHDIDEWIRSYGEPREFGFKNGRVIRMTAKKTNLGGYMITVVDLTSERRSEANAQDMLREAVETLDDAIMLFDQDLKLEVFNRRATAFFQHGDTPFEAGQSFYDIWCDLGRSGHWVLASGVDPEARAVQAVENVRDCAKYREIQTSDGRILLASSHRTDQGGYLLVYRDKTEETQLEGLFTDVIEHLPVGIAVEGDNERLTHCNDAFSRIYGVPADTLKKTPRMERITQLYEMMNTVNGVSCEGVPLSDYAALIKDHTDNFIPVEVTFHDGRHILLERAMTRRGETILVLTDTTSVKAAQADRLSLVSDAIEGTGEALVLYDKDKNYVLSNQAWQDMFWSKTVPPQPGESVASLFQRLLDEDFYAFPVGMTKEQFYDLAMDAFDNHGKNVPMDTSAGRNILASSHKTGLDGYLLSFRDVTEERSSETKARDMLLDAFEAIDEGLVLCDQNMNFVFGNKAWKKMNFEGAEHLIPEPGDSVLDNVVQMVMSGLYDTDGMSKEDYLQWMMGEMAQHGKKVHVKFTNGRHILGSSHLTAFGGSLLFIRDITEQQQLEAELEQQRDIAHQNEKISALGELLAGVAHELNNPLSVVFGYSQMLQGKINDPVLSERVDLICQSSERAAKIVRTFLAMARQRPTSMEPCAVNEIVETALEVSSYSLKTNGTEVIVDLDATAPHVTGDFDQLAQVFSNLIVNAGHAVASKGSRGTITVATRAEGGQVRIDISDNGGGIPKDIQSRIFEPFFTTKDVGEGTGIGLAFSHRIVESHDGTLTVESTVGQGATFTVRLLGEESPDMASVVEGGQSQTGRSVLVVDDEEGVARLISDLLREAGYSVTMSTDPTAALKLAETQPFDAVLSDFKMPQMNGETFFRAMQAVAPENAARTGFITGDAMSTQVTTFFKASARPHIEKPIMKDELMELLASLIGETS